MSTRQTLGIFGSACFLVSSVVLFSAAGSHAAPQSSASGYHLVKKVLLGGGGGLDYLSADPVSHHVFISRGTHVLVVNPDGRVWIMRQGKPFEVLTEIPPLRAVGATMSIAEGFGLVATHNSPVVGNEPAEAG